MIYIIGYCIGAMILSALMGAVGEFREDSTTFWTIFLWPFAMIIILVSMAAKLAEHYTR